MRALARNAQAALVLILALVALASAVASPAVATPAAPEAAPEAAIATSHNQCCQQSCPSSSATGGATNPLAMPQFDMTGHALLSPTARTIAQADAGAFLALQTLAEEMLRLADADLVVGQVDLARMAVARQLNLLAARSPEQELLSSERRGEDQEFRYRTGAPAIDPVAALIVRQLGIDPEAGTASYDAARRC